MTIDTPFVRRVAKVGVVAAAALLVTAGVAGANVPLTQVSADPFTNATSQHATEVEPDTFADHGTVVATFQVGRFFNGGATDIGFARSGDGGATWDPPGFLPGLTFSSGADSPYERVSDPSVAYDAAHATWLISSLPLLPNIASPTVLVSRSTDDGRTWGDPVSIPPPVSHSVDLDKNWTVCDNVSAAFRGHCYTELDNFL
ncbi:MAG: exo-alpha-sialidase [Actinobacteria bacterium]|nr:MAG: exo-alpha-sialidase [Actinomycetota bacterium]